VIARCPALSAPERHLADLLDLISPYHILRPSRLHDGTDCTERTTRLCSMP
jgi:hypothetical protein